MLITAYLYSNMSSVLKYIYDNNDSFLVWDSIVSLIYISSSTVTRDCGWNCFENFSIFMWIRRWSIASISDKTIIEIVRQTSGTRYSKIISSMIKLLSNNITSTCENYSNKSLIKMIYFLCDLPFNQT